MVLHLHVIFLCCSHVVDVKMADDENVTSKTLRCIGTVSLKADDSYKKRVTSLPLTVLPCGSIKASNMIPTPHTATRRPMNDRT